MSSEWSGRATTPPAATGRRLMRCIVRQRKRTPVCPDQPRLDGRLALVTGGNAGIGFEASAGLGDRGAEVIIAARIEQRARAALYNTMGRRQLSATDPGRDEAKACALWLRLEQLGREYLA